MAAVRPIPVVTRSFWPLTVLSTALGAAAADTLDERALVVLALIATAGAAAQPVFYWPHVVALSAGATRFAVAVPWLIALLAVLVVSAGGLVLERTLTPAGTVTSRRAVWCSAALFAVFALGQATGDHVTAHVEFTDLVLIGLYGAVLAMLAIARLGLAADGAVTFWLAAAFAQPFGASIDVALRNGFGRTAASAALLVCAVTVTAWRHGRQAAGANASTPVSSADTVHS